MKNGSSNDIDRGGEDEREGGKEEEEGEGGWEVKNGLAKGGGSRREIDGCSNQIEKSTSSPRPDPEQALPSLT